MGNILKTSNEKLLPKTLVLSAAGALALNTVGCGSPAEAQPDRVIVCSGLQSVDVKPGDTASGLIREHAATEDFTRADIHNVTMGLHYDKWLEKANDPETPAEELDMVVIHPSELPTHNTSRVPGLTAGETHTVPEICYIDELAGE